MVGGGAEICTFRLGFLKKPCVSLLSSSIENKRSHHLIRRFSATQETTKMAASEPRILIYLLRRDLRVGDNPILHAAVQAFQQQACPFTHLLPLYVFSSRQIEVSGFLKSIDGNTTPTSPFPEARSTVGRFWRCGPHRAKFLGESVWDLKTSLEAHNSGLSINVGSPGDVIRDALAFFKEDPTRGQVAGVWMTGEDTVEEVDEQNDVRSAVEGENKEFKLFKDEKYFVDE
jgi:deoxyribodipyrimidine photo-lyase